MGPQQGGRERKRWLLPPGAQQTGRRSSDSFHQLLMEVGLLHMEQQQLELCKSSRIHRKPARHKEKTGKGTSRCSCARSSAALTPAEPGGSTPTREQPPRPDETRGGGREATAGERGGELQQRQRNKERECRMLRSCRCLDVGRDLGGAADTQHGLQQAEGWEALGKTCPFPIRRCWVAEGAFPSASVLGERVVGTVSPPKAQRFHGKGVVRPLKVNQLLLGLSAAVAPSVGAPEAAIRAGLGQLSHGDNRLVERWPG